MNCEFTYSFLEYATEAITFPSSIKTRTGEMDEGFQKAAAKK
jgi:hypothetical protein